MKRPRAAFFFFGPFSYKKYTGKPKKMPYTRVLELHFL